MSSLDEKLEETLDDAFAFGTDHSVSKEEAIPAIKQAFIDDGWVKIPQVEIENNHTNAQPTSYTVMGKPVMTGREWFSKFEQELGVWTSLVIQDAGHPDARRLQVHSHDAVIAAAKKASGIE